MSSENPFDTTSLKEHDHLSEISTHLTESDRTEPSKTDQAT